MTLLPGPYTRAGLALSFLPLYLGPVLAGMARHPWPVILVIVLPFLIYALSAAPPMARGSAMLARLTLLAVVQTIVVVVAYGLGAALAALLGPLALAPFWPAFLSGLGALWAMWRMRHRAAMDELLDDAMNMATTGIPPAGNIAEHGPALRLLPPFAPAAYHGQTHAPHDPADLLAALMIERARNIGEADAAAQCIEATYGPKRLGALLAFFDEGDPAYDFALLRYIASPAVRAAYGEQARMKDEPTQLALALDLGLFAADPGTRSETASLIHTLIDEAAPPGCLPDPADWKDDIPPDNAPPTDMADVVARLTTYLAQP